MRSGTLVPNVSEVKLVCLRARHGTIEIELRACRIFSYCPSCGVASRRIHSRYVRKVSDLLIDLLPDREADTVAAWLEHLGIEVVSRDRGGIYAEAARRAAPSATQVADRWHVLRNLSEALKKALDPHHRVLTQAARVDRADETPPVTQPQAPWNARELLVQQRNRQRRLERYQQVRSLMKTGASMAAIAQQIGIDHRTVRKFIRAEVFPEAAPRIRRCIVDPYAEYLDKRL